MAIPWYVTFRISLRPSESVCVHFDVLRWPLALFGDPRDLIARPRASTLRLALATNALMVRLVVIPSLIFGTHRRMETHVPLPFLNVRFACW